MTVATLSLIEVEPASSHSNCEQRLPLRCAHLRDTWILPDPTLGFVRLGLPPGLGSALNASLAAATGDIVAWHLPGDRWVPAALTAVAQRFSEEPTVDVVYGDAIATDSAGSGIERVRSPRFNRDVLIYDTNFIIQATVFMRRNLVRRIGPLDESFRHLLDLEYVLRAAKHGAKFALLPQPLAMVRMGARSDAPTAYWDEYQHERARIVKEYARVKAQHPSALRALRVWFHAVHGFSSLLRGQWGVASGSAALRLVRSG